MAVKIRLKRLGKLKAPQYRIVVVDGRKKRDGKVIADGTGESILADRKVREVYLGEDFKL